MRYLLLCCLLLLFSCTPKETVLSGKDIITRSIQKHDPKKQWATAKIKIRTQEPRLQTPTRYSIVKLDNATGAFSLHRNRDHYISNHLIDSVGNAVTFLDHKIVTDTTLIKKYRLEPKRNSRYRRYFQSFTGFPMSLQIEKFEKLDSIGNTTETVFNNIDSYKVTVALKEPMFSKHMNVYFAKKDFRMIGIDMISLEEPTKGERIYFEGSIQIQSFTLARYKHWHDLSSGEYLGSDIIVKEIK
ncbi:MAG: hypothetical protein JXQ93_08345 [Flavobacteriaceae bacterium]